MQSQHEFVARDFCKERYSWDRRDLGTQYRSVIFYVGEEQKRIAEEVIRTADASGDWKAKIVTEVVPFKEFYRAEEYHQKYLVKHPQGYTCHYVRRMKLGE